MSIATPQQFRSAAGSDAKVDRPRWRKLTVGVIGGLVLALAALLVAAFFIDPRLRTEMERRLNANLEGYTARLADLDFHPFGFAITLKGLTIRQNQNPKPAVIEIPRFEASVQWRELLRLRLVADMLLVQPKLHVDGTQYESESEDPIAVEDKGWQKAVESIYPLKINEFRIEHGDFTYIDSKNEPPLHLSDVNIVASNIRNVRDAGAAYPSEISARATVFDSGSVHIDGHADFLQEPHVGVSTDVSLDKIPLDKIKPVSNNANIWISGGTLSAQGHVEYAPKTKVVHLKEAIIQEVNVDYVHSPKTLDAEAERVEQVKEAVDELTSTPETIVLVDDFRIRNSRFAYVDETTSPSYQLLLTNTDATLANFSNEPSAPDSVVTLNGLFMGSGKTTMKATFQPMAKTAELDIDLGIEPTPLTSMNDLLRAYGGFDVVAGSFAFYSNLSVHNGEIKGWVKPLFRDMNVYSASQDGKKGVLRQVYENVLEGVKLIFENSSETVATETRISGKIDSPEVSTWEVLINLATNAFIRAIAPGFESQLGYKVDTTDTTTPDPQAPGD